MLKTICDAAEIHFAFQSVRDLPFRVPNPTARFTDRTEPKITVFFFRIFGAYHTEINRPSLVPVESHSRHNTTNISTHGEIIRFFAPPPPPFEFKRAFRSVIIFTNERPSVRL